MYPNNYPYTPPAPPPAPTQAPSPQEASARNLQYIKEFCRKPIVLALAIVFSVSVVLTLISSLTTAETTIRGLSYLLEMDRYSQYQSMMSFYTFTLIITMIPSILTAAAFWMIHLRSRSDDPAASPMTGFSILRVLVIIQIVLVGILGLFLFIVIGVASSAPDSTGYLAAGIAVMVFMIIIVVGVLVLYSVAQLLFVNSFKNSVRTPRLQARGTVLYGVLMCLSALSSLSSLSPSSGLMEALEKELPYNYSLVTSTPPIAVISTLLSVAFAVCAAICAFSYSSYVKKVNMQMDGAYSPTGVPPYMGDPSQAPYQQANNPQQGYSNPYQPQNYSNPYQQPQNYSNPYQPQQPQDYTNPYQQNPPAQQPYAPLPYQPSEPPVTPQAPAAPAPQPPAEEPAAPQDAPADAEVRFCPMCGERVSAGAAECSHCGMKL